MSDLNQTLLMLDDALSHRQQFIDFREQQIAVASSAEQRYLAYDAYNADSALYYAERMVNETNDPATLQRALIYRAKALAVHGLYDQATAILLSIEADSSFASIDSTHYRSSPNALLFYQALGLTYVWQAEFSTIQTEKDYARAAIPEIRRRIITLTDDPVWRVQEQALLLLTSETHEAIRLLHTVVDTLPESSDYIRFLANSLGSCYREIGDEDSALYYFALSAISDMEHGVMEHCSLREVALILFRRGDIDRAYRYMNTCVLDAQFCRARLRTIEMANDMPLILTTYQHEVERRQQVRNHAISALIVAVLVLFALLCVVGVLLRRVSRARRELLAATRELHRNHVKLQQASRIRNTYLTQYIRECSDIIDRIDTHQRELIHIARQGKAEPLYNAVRSTEFIDGILRDFYTDFDASFLALFPHFVDDLNALLRPEAHFSLPRNNRLSTPLRICALIRLGVTDSEDIARFLRHSTKTIFNYRANIRNAAIGPRDSLEDQIRLIAMQ